MVQIAGRKSGRGKLIQDARIGVVMKPYEPTGAAWITRVQVLVGGELEDINVVVELGRTKENSVDIHRTQLNSVGLSRST